MNRRRDLLERQWAFGFLRMGSVDLATGKQTDETESMLDAAKKEIQEIETEALELANLNPELQLLYKNEIIRPFWYRSCGVA